MVSLTRMWKVMTMNPPDEPRCVNHKDEIALFNLDGDWLCRVCCNAWTKAEGIAAHEQTIDEYLEWNSA